MKLGNTMRLTVNLIFIMFISLFLAGCSEKAPDWKPDVVPFLDNEPSDIDGQGSAVLKPITPLTASSRGDFEITFTVGESGIVSGGFIMLQISPFWGWSQPQITHPEVPGYTTVETFVSNISIQVFTLPLNRIVVFSREREFRPGEKIIFNYGNGAQVDRFAEADELFQVFVDADGDGHSACIANPPSLRIMAGATSRLSVTAPSRTAPGKMVEVRAAPLDERGN